MNLRNQSVLTFLSRQGRFRFRSVFCFSGFSQMRFMQHRMTTPVSIRDSDSNHETVASFSPPPSYKVSNKKIDRQAAIHLEAGI